MAATTSLQQIFADARRDFERDLPPKLRVRQLLAINTPAQVWDEIERLQDAQSRSARMRNMKRVKPFLDALKSFSAVIEVFIQVKPEVMALVWGPIKLVLQLIDNWNAAYDAITATIGSIGQLLPRFERAVKPFADKDWIKEAMGLFYRDILDFNLELLDFLHRPRVKDLFETMWPKRKQRIEIIEKNLKAHAALLSENVTLENVLQAKEARELALAHYEKEETRGIRQAFEALCSHVAAPSYDRRLQDTFTRVCPGSFAWLLSDAQFRQWLDAAGPISPNLLWLQGIPGAGKTYLSAVVVNEAIHKHGRAIYVFPRHHEKGISATSLLQSMLFQLAADSTDLMSLLNAKQVKSNIASLRAIFTNVVRLAGKTFVVVDGLDEVEDFERRQFLEALLQSQKDCQGDPDGGLSICISSRAEHDLEAILGPTALTIRVDRRNTTGIQAFVDRRFREWMADADFLPDRREEIQALLEPVPRKAKGMFLYARVVIDNVVDLPSMEEVRRELRVLPESLDDAYARVLARIRGLPTHRQEMARRVIAWLGCSPVPLKTYELEQAVLIGDGNLQDAPLVDSSMNLVKLCGSIVEVVGETPQLVHFTAHEYIFQRQPAFLNLTESVMDLLVACLIYLCFPATQLDVSDEDVRKNVLLGKHRLHVFASKTWFELVRQYKRLTGDEEHIAALNTLLYNFASERENADFRRNTDNGRLNESQVSQNDATTLLPLWPGMPEYIGQTLTFWKDLPKDLWTCDNAETWVNSDPLIVSKSCARVEVMFHDLLQTCTCSDQQAHSANCHLVSLKRHYGQRLYKCRFFDCPRRREGFEDAKDQREHMEIHCRPYKCRHGPCDWTVVGFYRISDMEEHHERCHPVVRPNAQIAPATTDEEALYTLFYEWVTKHNLEELQTHWHEYDWKLSDATRLDLLSIAAGQGSLPMVKLMLPWHDLRGRPQNDFLSEKFATLVADALESKNDELIRWILKKAALWGTSMKYRDVVVAIIKTEDLDLFETWITILESTNCFTSSMRSELFERTVLNTANNYPTSEGALMQGWRRLRDAGRLGPDDFGSALVTLAQKTRSVEQARVLLDLGAPINYPCTRAPGKRTKGRGMTALQWSLRKPSQAGAKLAKFLLFEGADTTIYYGDKPPMEEEGAQQIETWLGMSWLELVDAAMKAQSEKTHRADA